jgi:hypothetical protein
LRTARKLDDAEKESGVANLIGEVN